MKSKYPVRVLLKTTHNYYSQMWLLEKDESTDNKLHYYGYSTTLDELPNLSETSEENQRKVIEEFKKIFQKDNIEIWLDDVKIKAKKGTSTITLKARLNEDKQIELDSDFAKKLDEVYQNSRAIGTLEFLEELEKTKFEKLYEMNIPFALIMNPNGLFDSKKRFEIFKNNNFEMLILQGRMNFHNGTEMRNSPNFQSIYICSGILKDKIMFTYMNKD